jgi:hypothetical protein
MSRVLLISIALLLVAIAPAFALTPEHFDFFAQGPYRENVPRPAQVLGYECGSFHTGFAQMERYVDAVLKAAPDRVLREPFGRSVEFRERALLVISSPENLAKLEQIRQANLDLADPRRTNAARVAEIAKSMPVTVWLNYSMHGDESASFEAMPYVVYQLVAGEDAATRKLRENAVILVNLAHNPDGHERFVTWVNALGQGNPETWSIEQQRSQPWGIGGRATHYQFDPNRDALAMSQPESQQSARELRRWAPQVFVDHHGQVASFFFPPNAPVENEALRDGIYSRWSEMFGHGNADAFDRFGWSYYQRQEFDFHAPEYWDIWPSLTGAIGMTYETDGGGNLAKRRDDGTVVTMRDGASRHFIASLATVTTAVNNREARLRDMALFAQHSVDVSKAATRGYVIDPGADPVAAAMLVENLQHVGVEVRWVAGAFTVKAARALFADHSKLAPAKWPGGVQRAGMPRPAAEPASTRSFANGAFVIDLAQPASRIARAVLEADASPDSAFVRKELAKYERNIARGKRAPEEDYAFYDLTSWSLALSYGVDVYGAAEALPAGVLLRESDPNSDDESTERLADSLSVGVPLTARVARMAGLVMHDAAGKVALDLRGGVDGEARTAYVWNCASAGAQRLALRLQQDGYRVATSTQPLRAGGMDWPRGTFLARIERNPASLHARINALAATCGVKVHAVQSAWIDMGDTGVGSEAIRALSAPHIAVLVDEPVGANAYGWLWFMFERRLGVRFTALRASRMNARILDKYNVLIVPDGDGGSLADQLGDNGITALKSWISRGGALVCMDDASEFPTLKNVGLSSARVVGVPSKPKDADDDAAPDSAATENARRPQFVPGTIFRAALDPRSFLSYGYTRETLPVLMQGQTFLKPSRDGVNAITFDRTSPTVTGWTWPETERRITGTAYAIDEPNGGGHVIMIAGPADFRSYWRSTERVLLNAVLYGPGKE